MPEQYLEMERKAGYRSEYYQGEMLAMAGAGVSVFSNDMRYSSLRLASTRIPTSWPRAARASIGCRISVADLYQKVYQKVTFGALQP